jgi:hypothetical protein
MSNLLKVAMIDTILSLHKRRWSKRREEKGSGIDGGTSLVRYGTVDLVLPGYRWSGRVGFHASFNAVLGHTSFLDHFTATFNGRHRYVNLTPNGSAPAPVGY